MVACKTMRTPRDAMSQRQLVYELRAAIDAARRHVQPSPESLKHLDYLVSINSTSIHSTHVQHNIGAARRAWLADFLARGRA